MPTVKPLEGGEVEVFVPNELDEVRPVRISPEGTEVSGADWEFIQAGYPDTFKEVDPNPAPEEGE